MSQLISIQFDHLDVADTLRRTGVMERTAVLEQFVEEEFVFAMRNINFSGESVQVSATDGQDRFKCWSFCHFSSKYCRWVVFAELPPSSPLRVLHESILSYQCLCRNQTIIS